MRRFFVCFLILAGCAAPPRVGQEKPVAPSGAAPAHPPRQLIVYIPQTDDAAAGWLKWFMKYPGLRMVIAMSPHFQHVTKDPQIKTRLQGLIKEGRLELALQIPNAPILPLLVDSSSAKDALPPERDLPNPPYAYPDDVVQLIAQSKAGFFKQWNVLPHGLVLPYGAASPKLVAMLERLGFSWMVAALEAPAADGPYQSGSLKIWDGAPSGKPLGTFVRVWDERQMKDRPLEGWMADMKTKNITCLLPQDPGIDAVPLSSQVSWKLRTWVEPDWSLWIGQSEKNAAWNSLRKAREALEVYKNSGQASVQRLDAAYETIYSAQSSNFLAAMGNSTLPADLVEERRHEFQATILAIYRVIGKQPPDDLVTSNTQNPLGTVHASSTTTHFEGSPDGGEHVQIEDAVGDAMVPGGPDLTSLNVWATTDAVHWKVTLATMTPAVIDIYVDLNGQPNAGTPTFLPGRPYGTSAIDAWEYAISFAGATATLYRTQGMGTFGTVQTFPVSMEGNSYRLSIPRDMMRGSPKRWGYQTLVLSGPTLSDFIDPLEISQKDLWQDLSSGKRSDIPFVHVRAK